jgi:DNA-3-methyladenine glycosylase
MFEEAGKLYVYFTYGMHYCCNVVVGPPGYGAAVLIRAVEPLAGESYMQLHRPRAMGQNLSNGPAKLCQALGIDQTLNGHDLRKRPLRLVVQPKLSTSDVVQTTRVGINVARDLPWRFYEKGNKFVSRPL